MITTEGAGYAELNLVLDRARRSLTAPVDVTDAQLVGLQRRWTVALSARLDAVLEDSGPTPLICAVADAWHALASEHSTLRRVLDAHEKTSPALARAGSVELRMLALAAGLIGVEGAEDEAVELGRAYRALIRTGSRQPVTSRRLQHARVR